MSKRRRRRQHRAKRDWVQTSVSVCEHKLSFTSPSAATRFMRSSRHGNRLSPYHCMRCHLWHLTGGRDHR